MKIIFFQSINLSDRNVTPLFMKN